MVSRYGPVKQENICILPPPPTHYRMIPPQRNDPYHVSTPPTYVPQQPPTQPGNQGPLRTIPPTGPPNQPSTPPNSDIKVQQMPQPTPMSITTYVQPQTPQIRGGQTFYRPQSVPTSQTQRMTNHRQGQQQMYQAPSHFVPMPIQPMYIPNPAVGFYNGGAPRQSFVPTTPYQMPLTQFATYQQPQTQTQATFFYNSQVNMRAQAPPVIQQSAAQPPPPLAMTQPPQQHTMPKTNKRRTYAIPIIDPATGVDRLNEVFEDSSHPASGESSARQTPQPAPPAINKEVQAAFAKQVAQAAMSGDDADDQPPHHVPPVAPPVVVDHTDYPQAVNSRYDSLVQSSKLQVQTKEFVPANQNADKETPVVSALTDAVEVTIANKQPKDRESPAKSRKPREQQKEPAPAAKEPPAPVAHPEQRPAAVEAPREEGPEAGAPAAPASPSANGNVAKETGKVERDERKKKAERESSESLPQAAQDGGGAAAAAGKSKSSSQRNKDAGKQQPPAQPQQQNNQPPPQTNQKQNAAAPPPVPQSQPAKSGSKTSKTKELNLKGATKEGTDMDAFNDNVPSADAVNANVTNSTAPVNDNFNVNPTPVNANTAAPAEINKKPETNEAPVTIKPEVKPMGKPKVDVCAIVKDVAPKVPKTFVTVPESQDETDKAVTLNNKKLVQAKNEVNAKNNAESGGDVIIDNRPVYKYKEDQWSPSNPDGKKIYDRDFLLSLRNDPKSRTKPDNIQGDVYRAISRPPGMGNRPDFAPSFGNSFMNKSSSQHGVPPKRNSQQGKIGGKSGSNANKIGIRVSISVREDVKLHESENAWRPARFNPGAVQTEEEKRTEELYKKVRSVLNKLTPQKFKTLISQVHALVIDNKERLQGVIDLVFEKAVDEPNFSYGYALMCRELAQMQVPLSKEEAEGQKDAKQEFVNFRKLLITRCQMEFEKNSADESDRNRRVKEIDECTDAEKKKDLLLELEEYDRRIRMKSLGNIRFIGELFKQGMLTQNIMIRCLSNLLENKDEERLECLCKLLTTVGQELEINKKCDLSGIFNTMKEIVDKKHGKISSRVRFMIQDVIDLRKNKWVPRRQDLNPKTIDQIQKEAENEQLNMQVMNSGPITPRRDDRGSGAGSDRKKKNINEDGWSTAPSRNRTNMQYSIQTDKLRNKLPQSDEPLGNPNFFDMWSRGANFKSNPMQGPTSNSSNIFAALENMPLDNEKRPSLSARSSNKNVYSSKGQSMERSYNKQYSDDGRGSRSGSQQRTNESSAQRPVAPPPARASSPKAQAAPTPSADIPVDQLKRRLENILEEYIGDCSTIEECDQEIKSSIHKSLFSTLVQEGYLFILERSKTARVKAGLLFAHLIKLETLPLPDYCAGLEEVLNQADDLRIDIPKIWDYLADILVQPLCQEALPIKVLHNSCNLLIKQGHAPKLLAPLFKSVVAEKGPNFLQSIWQFSGLQLTDFMNGSEIEKFIEQNQFEFLLGGGDACIGQSELSYEQIHEKLLQLFNAKATFDDVVNWINANVGAKVKEPKFIRTLVTAIFENSIVKKKLNPDTLKNHYHLIHRFVDGNPQYELECLYALQSLINKLEHPQGLLLSICGKLYEDGIFPQDSFIAWETSDDPAEQAGKGVALKQLTSFFTQLKENDDEDYGSSASDEG